MLRLSQTKNSFTLIETLVVVCIFSVMMTGTYQALFTGQSLWFQTETNIKLREDLRNAIEKIIRELQQSGNDQQGINQTMALDGEGFNKSDIVRFSIPVVCEVNKMVIDPKGNVAHWGAPLTWGCTEASCMDADDNCNTVDYKYLEYLINNKKQLVRRVLDYSWKVIREDIFAQNITDFQADESLDGRTVNIHITAQDSSAKANAKISTEFTVYLRNKR